MGKAICIKRHVTLRPVGTLSHDRRVTHQHGPVSHTEILITAKQRTRKGPFDSQAKQWASVTGLCQLTSQPSDKYRGPLNKQAGGTMHM